jgi:cobalt/nickel transport protein
MKSLIHLSMLTILLVPLTSMAHFQLLLPPSDIIESITDVIELDIRFTHPMRNGPVMEMGKPLQVGVMVDGKKNDLLPTLKRYEINSKSAYKVPYKFDMPADYIFYLEPAPYWEPAEAKMIIHYTKVVVDVLGAESGWDDMVGFPVEIKPLSRPYSLYAGNIFQGVVMKNGKEVPFGEVEVEYLNSEAQFKAPFDSYITQVIKADKNGVFSYALPQSGWWGFAALVDSDMKMKNPKGKEVDVELGGVIWIKAEDFGKGK